MKMTEMLQPHMKIEDRIQATTTYLTLQVAHMDLK